MPIFASFFVFLFFNLMSQPILVAKEKKTFEYIKYVDEIINEFVVEMAEKHNIHCCGSGGSMSEGVAEIEVIFISNSEPNIENARKIEISAIQDLLHRINVHEKIRPFLREYPFNADRVSISISFETKTGERPKDGAVAFIFLAKNKLFYRSAEMKLSASFPLTRVNSHNEWTTEIIPGELQEELIPLMEETYEEALKIVESEQNKKGNNHECKQK